MHSSSLSLTLKVTTLSLRVLEEREAKDFTYLVIGYLFTHNTFISLETDKSPAILIWCEADNAL
jgi:hypothetical protein